MSPELDKTYVQILEDLKEKIRIARLRTSFVVNAQLLQVYWEIGQTISEQQESKGWGSKIIERLASDLKLEFEDVKGLSPRNLRYMRDFAKAYPDFLIVQQPAAQLQITDNQNIAIWQQPAAKLPWGHHQVILDRLKTFEERSFYIQCCAKNTWSRDVLVHQIESSLHTRQGALTHNFGQTLPEYQSELAQQLFKDPYQLDFIALGIAAKERDLENAMMNHITKVLIELGDGFAFKGRQYRLEAGGQEYFLDLLFYHTKLYRHVVIELKIGDFMPEYAGKMNFYLSLADDILKGPRDEATIGLILCKTKNKIVAEYALRDTSKPIGISEYRINELLPENIKGELPSIEEIEDKLEIELDKPTSPLEAKLARIKELTKNMKGQSLQPRNAEIVTELFTKTLPLLKGKVTTLLSDLLPEFESHLVTLAFNERLGYDTEPDLQAELLQGNVDSMSLKIELRGFIKAETKAFSIYKNLRFELKPYAFQVLTMAPAEITVVERLYNKPLTEIELNKLAEQFVEIIADDVARNIERVQI